MNYLKNTLEINEGNVLPEDIIEGTLVISDSQKIIDECASKKIPAAAYEHGGIRLSCDYVLTDVQEVQKEYLENIYRRQMGIPWDIARTKRCLIREFAMDDLDKLFSLYNEPGITEFMEPLFEYEKEKEYEKNYIKYIYKPYEFGMWLVFDRYSNELIGRAGIEVRESCRQKDQAELGFCISTHRWRQGLAFEVCSEIIRLAGQRYGLKSLIARCSPDNTKSQGLLSKLGFMHEGYEKDGDMRFFREI